MVVIRLSRRGSKGRAFYNIVVTDSRKPRDGQPIERLGFHNAIAQGTQVSSKIDIERFNYWKSQGAQPTPKVKQLVKDFLKTNPNTEEAAA